jgi:hypothetical protein
LAFSALIWLAGVWVVVELVVLEVESAVVSAGACCWEVLCAEDEELVDDEELVEAAELDACCPPQPKSASDAAIAPATITPAIVFFIVHLLHRIGQTCDNYNTFAIENSSNSRKRIRDVKSICTRV